MLLLKVYKSLIKYIRLIENQLFFFKLSKIKYFLTSDFFKFCSNAKIPGEYFLFKVTEFGFV